MSHATDASAADASATVASTNTADLAGLPAALAGTAPMEAESSDVTASDAAPSLRAGRRRSRRRRWRAAVIAGAAAVAVGASVAAAVGYGGDPPGTPRRGTLPPATAQVTRTTLVDYQDADGELAYGDTVSITYTPPSNPDDPDAGQPGAAQPGAQPGAAEPPADTSRDLVTWLPALGAVVGRGETLFKVDNEPVVLLLGPLPLYRTLEVGVKGPDGKQFEENLVQLGYDGFTVDETYTSATASAVKRWQDDLGVVQTGNVVPGHVIYSEAAIRVAEHKLRVGGAASGEILTYTGTTRLVTLDLDANDQRLASNGAAVTVTLPDGRQFAGTVASVGAVTQNDNQGGGPGAGGASVEVVVSIAEEAGIGALQQAAVQVRFVAEERKDVLTVPVGALLALAEGGYGVQVVDDTTARIVAVQTGMFAGGRVEVRGGGLTEGMTVGVTA